MRKSCLLAIVMSVALATSLTAAEPRHIGMLSDGNRVPAGEISNWQDPAQQPALSGKPLFDAANPFRWVLDTTHPPPASPAAYVEFFGGDRLPGEVLESRDGRDSRAEQLPPYLVVKTTLPLGPNETAEDVLRVSTEWVRRVVWESSVPRDYQPGTLFMRDGRALPFRSLRWSGTSVTLLLDEGVQTAPLVDLAEVHLPRRDSWDTCFDALAVLSPDARSRLIQLETTDGLRATTSTERFRPEFRGDRAKSDNWVHVVQPVWSLDLMWVRFPRIRSWRFSAPHQVALTQLGPSRVRQQSYFGSAVRWQCDRSVPGQTLNVAGQLFPWGFGVQADNELSFDLHPAVRSFRTQFGLDQTAGEGGCVRGMVLLETEQRRPLVRSDVLIGSKSLVDSGAQSLRMAPGQPARLVLAADPVLEGRPKGADPFDIRDFVDWMQPEFELDPAMVAAEIRKRSFARVAALSGWALPLADQEQVRLSNHWDESHPRDPRFRVLLSADQPFVAMSEKMRIEKGDRWLAVAVTRPPTRTTPVRVQARIEGTAVGEFEVPVQASPLAADPILIPVERFQGKSVTVELIQMSDKPDGAADWRGVTTIDRRPGLLRLFDDEPEFPRNLNEGDGTPSLENAKPFRGDAALRVTAPSRGNSKLPGLEAVVREYPDFGEYRYIRFAWKNEGGSQLALGLGHHGLFGGDDLRGRGRFRPGGRTPFWSRGRRGAGRDDRGLHVGYRYDAGKGPPLSGAAIRLGGPDPNWVEITRDLYSDFGNFTLTGLQFFCPDGEGAWFDQIYLGRTVQDFEGIVESQKPSAKPDDPPENPDVVARGVNRWDYVNAISPIAPLFSSDFVADGAVLWKEFRNRKNVLTTNCPDNAKPCVLRAAVAVPKGKPCQLEIGAGQDGEARWQLVVTANGQTIHDGVVGPDTAKDGWLDLKLDLARFGGQNVVLTCEHRPAGGKREIARWSRIAVVPTP